MAWVRFDDGFDNDPDLDEISPAAACLHLCGTSYCARELTDGRVPKGRVAKLHGGADPASLQDLLTVGWWIDEGTHYQIRSFLKYNPSKSDVQTYKGVQSRRWAMQNNPELRKQIKLRDGNNCRYCGCAIDWMDRKGSKGATYDHIVPLSEGGNDEAGNLVACCRQCNSVKGARTLDKSGLILHEPGFKSTNYPGGNLDNISEGSRCISSIPVSRSRIPYPVPVSRIPEPEPEKISDPPGDAPSAVADPAPADDTSFDPEQSAVVKADPPELTNGQFAIARFIEGYQTRYNARPDVHGRFTKPLAAMVDRLGRQRYEQSVIAYFATEDPWAAEKGHDMQTFVSCPVDRWIRGVPPTARNMAEHANQIRPTLDPSIERILADGEARRIARERQPR